MRLCDYLQDAADTLYNLSQRLCHDVNGGRLGLTPVLWPLHFPAFLRKNLSGAWPVVGIC